MKGLHQLLHFPSLAGAREFAARISAKGDLQDGRPLGGDGVRRGAGAIVDQLGQHERSILTGVPWEDLVRVTTPKIAEVILNQRTGLSPGNEPRRRRLGQDVFGF